MVVFALVTAGHDVAEASVVQSEMLCALVEDMPHQTDPLRRNSALTSPLRTLDRIGLTAKQARKVQLRLQKTLNDALTTASRVFGQGEWTRGRAAKARRFLRQTSQGPQGLLQVGVVGFEPRSGLRAALQRSACVAGRYGDAIAYGRGASGTEGSAARAFAALLLHQMGRTKEAAELLPTLQGEGFLVHYVRAELHPELSVRRQAHTLAARRASQEAQRTAITQQAQRLAATGDETP